MAKKSTAKPARPTSAPQSSAAPVTQPPPAAPPPAEAESPQPLAAKPGAGEYTVTRTVRFGRAANDQREYSPGSSIRLNDEEAKPLLACGAIE